MLQLSLSSIAEENKVKRLRGQTIFDESADSRMQKTKVQLSQGGRWFVQRMMDDARRRILHKELVCTVRQEQRGLNVSDRKK